MPRTSKKPRPPSPPPPPAANGQTEVLTLAEAAAYLRLPEEEVVRLVYDQGLPARQTGTEWRFLKSAIQDWLRTGSPSQSNKDAWTALAGVWKDDPHIEEIVKEAYRRRGRPITAD